MRPDRRERGVPGLGAQAVGSGAARAGRSLPVDVELEALEAELGAAGRRARRAAPAAPTAAFGRRLRASLLGAARPEVPAVETAAAIVAGAGVAATDAAGGVGNRAALRLAPEPVRPRVAARSPRILSLPRWSILVAAAALVAAVAGFDGTLLRPVPADNRATAALDATLTRGTETTPLVAGADVRRGDEVRVGPDGSATLQLGDGHVRLAPGTEVRLVALDRNSMAIDQLAGRAWYRVVPPTGGGRFVVTTADVTWTAVGTAFDLDREAGPSGDVVRELSIEHTVAVAGPGLRVSIPEGRAATVVLGAESTIDTTAVPVDEAASDPWLVANARADAAEGFDLGMLAVVDLAATSDAPDPGPTEEPASSGPTVGPSSEPTPTMAPTPRATPRPTPRPTKRPTPEPTATPPSTPETMNLGAEACPGAVRLAWTMPDLATFDHLQVLRGASPEIPIAWPPAAGVVAFDGGYTKDPSVRDAYDPGLAPASTAWYRAVAYDASNHPIAASSSVAATGRAVAGLGALSAGGSTAGQLDVGWTPFAGSGDCFSATKLVGSLDNANPSYFSGATLYGVVTSQSAGAATITGLTSGQTIWFRAQVVRATGTGLFLVAQTDPVQVTVP